MATTDTAAAAGISVTVAGMMMSGFTTFLPPLREIRQATPGDATMRHDVRYGQCAAGTLAVGVGGLMSWLTGSSTPIYIAIFTTLLYAAIYEMALRDERS